MLKKYLRSTLKNLELLISDMEINRRRIEDISGFTSLLLTVIACILTFSTQNYFVHALFVLWLSIILMYFGLIKQSIIYVIVYIFSVFWLLEMVPKGVLIISPMLLGMIYKFIVPIMAGYLSFKIPSGKLIAVFHKSSLPKSIILILMVIIRFIPTISGELRTIFEAMKVRGFTGSFLKMLSHPLKTIEYAFVPLIFRSIKVGDELAVSSIVRGIENPSKKNCYYSTKLGKIDFIIIIISVILLVFGLIK